MSDNYPRLNEFPEWYVVDLNQIYVVRVGNSADQEYLGSDLIDGLPMELSAIETTLVEVRIK